jgi:hypothetical protein
VELLPQGDVPGGLSRRADYHLRVHGVRVAVPRIETRRLLDLGMPPDDARRVADFQRRWGGWVLPPGAQYSGGPLWFRADVPEPAPGGGWRFDAGPQRTAVPYGFMVGPGGEFGIHAERWTPLHATVEGWVEALALTAHVLMWARRIIKVTGGAVDSLDLSGYAPVHEVAGLADTWWRGGDELVALYTGEAECFDAPGSRLAIIYSGLDAWGLRGGGPPED